MSLLIKKMKSYVVSSSTVPMILVGENGSGKTSLLNAAKIELEKNP
jgi:predicted ATP-binding protein involved in virulence